MTHRLYLRCDLQRIESQQQALGVPLMERAGAAAAKWIAAHFPRSQIVTVLVGPGNNGGDGYICARHLYVAGFAVHVWPLLGTDRLPADAAQARRLWLELGPERLGGFAPGTNLIVDAVFGIGLNRPLPDEVIQVFEQIEERQLPVVALDIPSGLDADTGQLHKAAIVATHTLTFIGDKPGLHTAHGQDHAGEVVVFDLDIPCAALEVTTLSLYHPRQMPAGLRRRQESNKGSFGSVAVIGGAEGMAGAAILASRAALRLGAGKVHVGMLAVAAAYDPVMPELMLSSAAALLPEQHDAWLVGPGLGKSAQSLLALEHVLKQSKPVVIDADALNLIATTPHLRALCQGRRCGTVITPHPAEAARLLGLETGEVQADRIRATRRLSEELNCIALIKGSGTIVAQRDEISLNGSGNAALASAGQGDVLGGIVLALIAQRLDLLEATRFAVYLHGMAADQWLLTYPAGIGLSASETAEHARLCLNRM